MALDGASLKETNNRLAKSAEQDQTALLNESMVENGRITVLTLLTNNKILDWSKLKAFADNKLKVAKTT